MSKNQEIIKQTVFVTVLSVAAMLIGLVGSLVSAYLYGASLERDAYLLAFIIPTYISSVISSVFPMVFIPIYLEYKEQDPQHAWRLASNLVNLTTVASIVIAVICFVFSTEIVKILAPGYGSNQSNLTVSLFRILIPVMAFASAGGLLSSIFYAEHKFIRPASASIVSTLVIIAINVILNPYLGISSLAVGTLLGSAVPVIMLFPVMYNNKHYSFIIDHREKGLTRIFRAGLPLFAVSLIYKLNFGFERIIGTNLPAGSISSLAYATQITAMMTTITSSGIATTIFPAISQSWAKKDSVAINNHLALGVRMVLMISLPITAGILVFRDTLLRVIFERGAFDHKASIAVGQCLVLLLGSFIAGGINVIVSKIFYVGRSTSIFAIYNIFETILYMTMAWFLSQSYSLWGLALASSIRDIVGLIVCVFLVKRFIINVELRCINIETYKIFGSSFILFVAYSLLNYLCKNYLSGIMLLSLAILFGGLLYGFLTIYIFKVQDAEKIFYKVLVKIMPSSKRLK